MEGSLHSLGSFLPLQVSIVVDDVLVVLTVVTVVVVVAVVVVVVVVAVVVLVVHEPH